MKRLQKWALCGAVALAGLLGAGQALAASSPPFVDNDDGTVTDTSTGLMWDQCTAGLSGNGSCATGSVVYYTWGDALELAETQNAANHKGYSDWRLPSVVELKTLLKGTTAPAIDTVAFPNTPGSSFWSASSSAPVPSYAWFVPFNTGFIGTTAKTDTYFVRLVRGGQYLGSFALFSTAASATTVSTATLTATGPVATTGYWLVVPRGATPPTPAQVMAGDFYGSVSVAAAGTGAMAAKSATSFFATGLAVGTAFDAYLLATESTYSTRSGLVGPLPFATTAISTSAIVIDPATPTTLYAGLDGGGVYASVDSSATWSAINTGLTNLYVRALALQNPTTLFAATYDGGVFKGTKASGNWSWAVCDTGASLGAAVRLRSLAVDASGTLYAGSETGVFRNTAACGAWTAQNTGMP